MTVAAVVVAAGRGTRLHGSDGGPKALVEAGGRPLLGLALDSLARVAAIRDVVVVHTPGHEDRFREVAGEGPRLVAGGASRTDSVRAGMKDVAEDVEIVAIHDAARALTPATVIERTLAALDDRDVVAAAPGLPLRDTVKRVADDGQVLETVDREDLWAVHTPQVVRRDAFDAVLAWAVGRGDEVATGLTDDLSLVEAARAAGVTTGRIVITRGDPRDLKVTYLEDLTIATALVRASGDVSAATERSRP